MDYRTAADTAGRHRCPEHYKTSVLVVSRGEDGEKYAVRCGYRDDDGKQCKRREDFEKIKSYWQMFRENPESLPPTIADSPRVRGGREGKEKPEWLTRKRWPSRRT